MMSTITDEHFVANDDAYLHIEAPVIHAVMFCEVINSVMTMPAFVHPPFLDCTLNALDPSRSFNPGRE